MMINNDAEYTVMSVFSLVGHIIPLSTRCVSSDSPKRTWSFGKEAAERYFFMKLFKMFVFDGFFNVAPEKCAFRVSQKSFRRLIN